MDGRKTILPNGSAVSPSFSPSTTQKEIEERYWELKGRYLVVDELEAMK